MPPKGFKKSKFLPFDEARKYVKTLKFKREKDWRLYCASNEKPKNIPSNPQITYKDSGWISWGDWLGTDRSYKKEFLSFEEAREFVRRLKFQKQEEWFDFAKSKDRPDNIPYSPNEVYKQDGWKGYGDWLRESYSFEDIKKIHKEHNLTSIDQYRIFRKDNPHLHLPHHPIKPFIKK